MGTSTSPQCGHEHVATSTMREGWSAGLVKSIDSIDMSKVTPSNDPITGWTSLPHDLHFRRWAHRSLPDSF